MTGLAGYYLVYKSAGCNPYTTVEALLGMCAIFRRPVV